MSAPLIELHGLSRRYVLGDQELYALRDIDLEIHAGEMVALMGASGSGKSTLLNILGCLDRPSSGVYRVDGRETTSLDATELAALRRDRFYSRAPTERATPFAWNASSESATPRYSIATRKGSFAAPRADDAFRVQTMPFA